MHTTNRHLLTIAIAGALLAACGGNKDGLKGLTYHADIAPIIEAKCLSCHVDGNIAPFSLDTYEQVYTLRDSIKHNTAERIMPPWLPGEDCTDYVGDRSLAQFEIDQIGAWIDDGAPEGDPADSITQALGNFTQMERVDLSIAMADPYTPAISPDDYRCFVIEWPEATTKFVTGFRVVPGEASIVHHVIAFAFDAANAQVIRDLDAAEPGPGYTCFGDAGQGDNLDGMSTLGAWAPGGTDKVLPPGLGMRMEPGSVIALQLHYNTLVAEPIPDVSSVEFMLEDTVEREAAILWWTDFISDWVGGTGMHIPAGEESVTHSFQFDPTPFMDIITGGVVPSNQAFEIHSATIHMHELGTRGYESIKDVDSSGREVGEECMLDVPRWDFSWQDSYGFMQPKTFHPGNELFLECEWDNSAANQKTVAGQKLDPVEVYWGEGTQDEMCLGVFLVSETP